MFNKPRYHTKKRLGFSWGRVINFGITTLNSVTENFGNPGFSPGVKVLANLCCQVEVTKYARILSATPNSSHARFTTIAKVANNKRHISFRDHSSEQTSTIRKLTSSYRYNHVYHFVLNFAAKTKP